MKFYQKFVSWVYLPIAAVTLFNFTSLARGITTDDIAIAKPEIEFEVSYATSRDFDITYVVQAAHGEMWTNLVLKYSKPCGVSYEFTSQLVSEGQGLDVVVAAKKTKYVGLYCTEIKGRVFEHTIPLGIGSLEHLTSVHFLSAPGAVLALNNLELTKPIKGLSVSKVSPICPKGPPGTFSCAAVGSIVTLSGYMDCGDTLGIAAAKGLSVQSPAGNSENYLFIDVQAKAWNRGPLMCIALTPVEINIYVSEFNLDDPAALTLVDMNDMAPIVKPLAEADVEVFSAKFDAATNEIVLEVGYGGGCGEHEFSLTVGTCYETYPVQCEVKLVHHSDDACEMYFRGEIRLGLHKEGLDDPYFNGASLDISGSGSSHAGMALPFK